MNRREELIAKAVKHISNLENLIQAEKEKDPFAWDKLNPWVNRSPDGKFGSGGGGGTKSSPSSSSQSSDAIGRDAQPTNKVDAAIQVAQSSVSSVIEGLQKLPQEASDKASELFNSPEVQKIHEDAKSELDNIHKDFGKVYQNTVDSLKDFDPKKIGDTLKGGLDSFNKKEPKDKANVALIGVGLVTAAVAAGFAMKAARAGKEAKQAVGQVIKHKKDAESLIEHANHIHDVIQKTKPTYHNSRALKKGLENAINLGDQGIKSLEKASEARRMAIEATEAKNKAMQAAIKTAISGLFVTAGGAAAVNKDALDKAFSTIQDKFKSMEQEIPEAEEE